MLRAVATRQIDPADEERGGERIRTGGVRGDDACAEDAIRRPAGPRIDDVTVAMPVGDRRTARRRRSSRAQRSAARRQRSLGRLQAETPGRFANLDRDRPVRAGCCRRPKAAHVRRPRRAGRSSPDRARSPCRSRRDSVQRPVRPKRTDKSSRPSCTASNPTKARAASIASGSGTHPWRRRNPQQRLSGIVVTSNAPPYPDKGVGSP